jgi:hypothetical protein
MSTRASIQLVDGDDVLYFYQHSDGCPEGLGEWLRRCLQLPCVQGCKDDIEYLAGMLMMEVNRDYIERNQHLPDMVPALGVHGDESYTYRIDVSTLALEIMRGAITTPIAER